MRIQALFETYNQALECATKMATDVGFLMSKTFVPKVIVIDELNKEFSWTCLSECDNIDLILSPDNGNYRLKIAIWWDEDEAGYEVTHSSEDLKECIDSCLKDVLKLANIYMVAAERLLTVSTEDVSIN